MALGPDHLAERLAAKLGGVGGLGAAGEGAAEARRAPAPQTAIPMPPPVDADRAPPNPRDDATLRAADFADGAPDGTEETLPPPPLLDGPAPDDAAADAPRPAPPRVEPRPIRAGQDRAARDADYPDGGALVLDRPIRGRGRDDIATSPGVNLDTMVPAPLTLDLVSLERAGLVVGRKARTRISEEFRVSVGQILRSVRGSYTPGRGAGNLVMVTSARPGEGKSFTSLNLAGSIAQHTQREVLLVDVDAKQNALSDQLGVGDRPGLIDLALTPSLRIEDTVVRTVIPNLSILPVGVRRVDSLEGGAEGTVARPITALIERLGRRFANHIILLDAPPCLSTSDPSTIAPLVGQVVMVVEAERTQRSEVLAALDLIKACPTITLMLNKIRVTTSYTFGAYHYFGSYS
jgi:protein-tyrosine kinase